MFYIDEQTTHNGWIERPVQLPAGAKGLRFWVMKGQNETPRAGIALRIGDNRTLFAKDSANNLVAALKGVPRGRWKQVETVMLPIHMAFRTG